MFKCFWTIFSLGAPGVCVCNWEFGKLLVETENNRNFYRCQTHEKKIYIFFFRISAVCIGVCAFMHATFLVAEIADRFLGQALYG